MNNIYNNKIIATQNVLGQIEHRNFIEVQAIFGIAQRGGSKLPGFSRRHSKRITTDVNLLGRAELRSLIFGESIFSN